MKHVSFGVRTAVFLAGSALAVASASVASTQVTDLGGDQYRVVFAFKAPPGTGTVHLAGTFNGWDPAAHALVAADGEHIFRTELTLGKGRHEYKFVLDNKTWVTDPDNPHKTPGYQNAILYLGIDPPSGSAPAIPPTEPVEMAGIVKHPAPVAELAARLKIPAKPGVASQAMSAWFAEHPMPLFTEAAVSFVYVNNSAQNVQVQFAFHGGRTGYRMPSLVDGQPVFAISLDRSRVPERLAYTYEVSQDGRTEVVVDPQAWSLTSRSGSPAAAAVEASDKRGRIEVIRGVAPSSGGLRARDVYVYLPPGYDRGADRRYPVLYMHDGQNCWDDPTEPFGHGGWCVNLAADRLIGGGRLDPFIAVGVANTPERMTEYGIRAGDDGAAPGDHPYLLFLKRDVKPLIDGKYRTMPDAKHTALMGSSMGGVVSLQAVLTHPDAFGVAACLSPAFEYERGTMQSYAELVRQRGKLPVRLYIDCGTGGRGQDGAPYTRKMVALLHETGWKDGPEFMYFEDTGAEHNERAWRARLERPLIFLFGR